MATPTRPTILSAALLGLGFAINNPPRFVWEIMLRGVMMSRSLTFGVVGHHLEKARRVSRK